MKIRTGFVSNSSSSSFVVAGSSFKNVWALADKMLDIRDEDWGTKDKDIRQRMRAALNQGMSPDSPISFPTTNEDTYIVKVDDDYVVATCNNHCWYDSLPQRRERPSAILEKLGAQDWECLEFDLMTMFDFYFPLFSITGRRQGYVRKRNVLSCGVKDHFTSDLIIKPDGSTFCPQCFYDRKKKK